MPGMSDTMKSKPIYFIQKMLERNITEDIKTYECGNCGYRITACQVETIKCEPLCPRCGKRCILDFTVVFEDEIE